MDKSRTVKEGEAAISLTEARRRQKQQYIETTWKRRKASQEMKKIQKAAKVAVAKKMKSCGIWLPNRFKVKSGRDCMKVSI